MPAVEDGLPHDLNMEEPSSVTSLDTGTRHDTGIRHRQKEGEYDESVERDTRLADDLSIRRVASRSPHPYHRRSVLEGTTRIKPDIAVRSREEPLAALKPKRPSYMREGAEQGLLQRTSRDAATGQASPSESGTEADDESIAYIRALPAPPLRPRKGLRVAMATGIEGQMTPLLTPTAIDEEATRFDFPIIKGKKIGQERAATDDELREARAKFVKRRRAELVRRASEVCLLALIGLLVLSNKSVRSSIEQWHRVELLSHVSIIATLYLLYPIRLIAYSWKRTKSWKPVPRTIRLPAAFDPAPLLYPEFLPVMIALVLLPTIPKVLLPNLILGLASVPAGLLRFGNWNVEPLRWLVAAIPLIASEHTDFPHKIFAIKPYKLKIELSGRLEPEILIALYPLHQALVQIVHYLATTSLLPAEVHLMSIGLINLLLCAEMPPTVILQVIIWLGGLSAIILVGPVIRWNIALARVPRWRFRRAGRLIQMRQSFLSTLNKALTRNRSAGRPRHIDDSDADDDDGEVADQQRRPSIISLETIKTELLGTLKTNLFSPGTGTTDEKATKSAVEIGADDHLALEKSNGIDASSSARPRRNTLPNLGTSSSGVNNHQNSTIDRKRKGYGKTLLGRSFLSLTQREATARKWIYAIYTYGVMVLLILGPIRNVIARHALHGHEPFGWAIGYLFGNLQRVRFFVWEWNLEWLVPLPPLSELSNDTVGLAASAEQIRTHFFLEANTRLLLCLWCLSILAVGLGVVLSFTFVEVDTRRKVFHGMMVAMLLPTIFIDPAFISLALSLILALFLILDLLRASQLPPLSRPIASFLTPYVDGRDLRGPIVVSHIFLLIGCAVPLWLSLAGASFSGVEPWRGWEVATRDVSMIAGVVCVGMGDAAASLIGRRYGRRKWPWTGGKSLEGSAAFAFAVTVGLVAAKLWLRMGRWEEPGQYRVTDGWLSIVAKASTAACGASFMEAVLTGGNDNVVVPVGLWILVRALQV